MVKTMFMTRLRITAATVLAVFLAIGATAAVNLNLRAQDRKPEANRPPGAPAAAPTVAESSAKDEERKDELDKRLLGKQLLHFDGTVKEGDPRDPTTQSPGTTYLDFRDAYIYFLEPIPDEWRRGPSCRLSPNSPLKYLKIFHGMRVVYDAKDRPWRIENYYAGVPHGQWVWFREGKPGEEINYRYGLRHGMSRNYTPDGKLLFEQEYREDKRVSTRSFHDNGRPDAWIVSGVVRNAWDKEGNPIPNK